MERVADPLRFAPTAAYVVVGVSRRFGRIVGYLSEAPYFDPQIITAYKSPHAAELPDQPPDVAGISVQQMAELHRGTPHRGSGCLTIATITSTEITTRRLVLNFSGGLSVVAGEGSERGGAA